jgi:metal-responsive CopG/Arc/MetJ family transcriptional regulator
MKVKTSITLERDVMVAIDSQVHKHGSRSEFLEFAARRLLARLAKKAKARRDLGIINRRSTALNHEAEDVLAYQVLL